MLNGTLQLMLHAFVASLSLWLGFYYFSDRPWLTLTGAAILWLFFCFYLGEAVWVPTWGTGRDWIDRTGIVIRGSGFALIALALLATSSLATIALALFGSLLLVFGRACWELILFGTK